MSKAYFLSNLAFEVLVRSQCTQDCFLPSEGLIEQTEDKDIIYCMHEMVNKGVLINEEGSEGFEIAPEYAVIVKQILDAKAILRVQSPVQTTPVYYYLTKKSFAQVDCSPNRGDAYRLCAGNFSELGETIHLSANLPDPEKENTDEEQPDWIEEELPLYEEAEKTLSSFGLGVEQEKLLEDELSICVIDVVSVLDGELLSRSVVYQPGYTAKMATFSPGSAAVFTGYDQAALSNMLNDVRGNM